MMMTTEEKRDESVRYQSGMRNARCASILIFDALAKGKIQNHQLNGTAAFLSTAPPTILSSPKIIISSAAPS